MALYKDVRVDISGVVRVTTLKDQHDASTRPGRDGQQSKNVLDVKNLQMDTVEYARRMSDAMLVMKYGYRVDPLQTVNPPVVETDEASSIAATTATLNGRVTGSGCTIGFMFGTTRDLATGGGTVVATTGSPTGVQTTIKSATYLALGLVSKTKYYYRIFAQFTATGNVQYGTMKAFITK
jgi:hypothetical protein